MSKPGPSVVAVVDPNALPAGENVSACFRSCLGTSAT
jgi:hypothetical protein